MIIIKPSGTVKKNTKEKNIFFQILITSTACLFNKILYSGKSISHHPTELIKAAKIWASVVKKFLQMLRYYKKPCIFVVSLCFLFRKKCRNVCWWQSWRKTVNQMKTEQGPGKKNSECVWTRSLILRLQFNSPSKKSPHLSFTTPSPTLFRHSLVAALTLILTLCW